MALLRCLHCLGAPIRWGFCRLPKTPRSIHALPTPAFGARYLHAAGREPLTLLHVAQTARASHAPSSTACSTRTWSRRRPRCGAVPRVAGVSEAIHVQCTLERRADDATCLRCCLCSVAPRLYSAPCLPFPCTSDRHVLEAIAIAWGRQAAGADHGKQALRWTGQPSGAGAGVAYPCDAQTLQGRRAMNLTGCAMLTARRLGLAGR